MKDAGARGYLLKNSSREVIQHAIEVVMAGDEYWLGHDNVKKAFRSMR
ncbi:MAG: hypothetical protein U5K54_29520 [Cytophagales bacterium]|nr:hypothetical protein [Cytophagales bacterium]